MRVVHQSVYSSVSSSLLDMSPVLAGFVGAGVLVIAVIALIFVWTCCQKHYNRTNYKLHGIQSEQSDPLTDPPYRFIHMLKGMSIYPDALNSSKRIIRVARQARSQTTDGAQSNKGRPVVLVDMDSAAESGLLGEKQMQMRLRAKWSWGSQAGEGTSCTCGLLLSGHQLCQQQSDLQYYGFQHGYTLHPRRRAQPRRSQHRNRL